MISRFVLTPVGLVVWYVMVAILKWLGPRLHARWVSLDTWSRTEATRAR